MEDVVHSDCFSVVVAENWEGEAVLFCEGFVRPGIVHCDSYDLGVYLVELCKIIS